MFLHASGNVCPFRMNSFPLPPLQFYCLEWDNVEGYLLLKTTVRYYLLLNFSLYFILKLILLSFSSFQYSWSNTFHIFGCLACQLPLPPSKLATYTTILRHTHACMHEQRDRWTDGWTVRQTNRHTLTQTMFVTIL